MLRVLAVCLVLVAASPAAAAIGELRDWAIAPSSDEAVVVMRVAAQPFDYGLTFSRDGKTGFLSRVYVINVAAGQGDQYVGRKLKPGRYVLTTLTQQKHWQSCFAEKAPVFEVQAGRIYYLGTLNAKAILRDLQEGAIARNRQELTRFDLAVGWHPTIAPTWDIAPSEMADFRDFVAKCMPLTTAPIELLPTEMRSMRVSATEKAIQICG